MNGYIYDPETMQIATKIENAQKCNDSTIKGEDRKARIGTGQYIITDADFNEGDILPDGIDDRRAAMPSLIEYD